MDPHGKAGRTARAVSEGLNSLGTLLCGPATRRRGKDVHALLERWERDSAAAFRELAAELRQADRARLDAALATLSAAARTGTNVDAPEELDALRRSIRDVMAALGIRIPELPAAEAAICPLHGAKCPALGEGAG